MRHLQNIIALATLFAVSNCGSPNREQSSPTDNLINLPSLGKVKPKNSSEISGSYWGIQASTLDPKLLQKAAEIGVKWTRLHCNWDNVEKEKGTYDWSETDEAFDAVLGFGIQPFVTIGHGNPVYSDMTTYDDPKLAQIYGYRPAPPIKNSEAMKAWLKFVELAIERYKDRITYWEIWNEPNHRNYWGGDPDGKEYGELVNQTAKIIRRLQPGAKIIAGSTAGIHPDFNDDFLSIRDNPELIDIITYHNYGAIPETRAYRAVELLKVHKKYKPDLELWQGECGYPSHSSSRDYRGRAPWGLNIQAKWLLRQAFTDTYFCEATMSNYFKLVHVGGRGEKQERPEMTGLDTLFGFPERGGSRVRTKGVNEKCILSNPDLEPKPGYFAYQNLCSVMDDRYKVFRTNHTMDILDPGIFYGIGEEDDAFPSVPLVASFKTSDNKHFVAYWLPWNAQENLTEYAEVSLTLANVTFDEPVLVNLLSGEVFQLERPGNSGGYITFEKLPLADFPMAIMEKSEVL